MKDNTLKTVLIIGAVAGGAYLFARYQGGLGDGDNESPLPQLPNISMPSLPQFNLPQMPQFSLPQMPQFSLPQMPQFNLPQVPDILPGLPELPQGSLPEFQLPDGGSSGDSLLQRIQNFLDGGNRHIETGSLYREGYDINIEPGTVRIGDQEWEKVPQHPGYQLGTGEFIAKSWWNSIINPFGTLIDTIRYGSPVVETVNKSDPHDIQPPMPEAPTYQQVKSRPGFTGATEYAELYDLWRNRNSIEQPTQSENSYSNPGESSSFPESQPVSESGLTLSDKVAASKILGMGEEYNKWVKDQMAGNIYDPVSPDPATCCGG